jgi:hypothetical protein
MTVIFWRLPCTGGPMKSSQRSVWRGNRQKSGGFHKIDWKAGRLRHNFSMANAGYRHKTKLLGSHNCLAALLYTALNYPEHSEHWYAIILVEDKIAEPCAPC